MLDSKEDREQIGYAPTFLCTLRKQNSDLTADMDKKIAEYLPSEYILTDKHNRILAIQPSINFTDNSFFVMFEALIIQKISYSAKC